MKEIEVSAGENIERACDRLVAAAPAFMVFNGVRVVARSGDSRSSLLAAWKKGMDKMCEESERKRRAYERTPKGKAEVAAAKAAHDEERRLRAETLAAIAASGVRERYPWDGLGEISGFGGAYEQACRDMVYAGIVWLERHPGADLRASTYRNVFGILNAESESTKELEKAVLRVCPDCSGAMHQATMMSCMFIAKNGWPAYAERMRKSSK